jgi:uncharacterized phage infection (PIP) family protein YhgE
VNIAVQDRAQRFMVPPVSLRNVTVYTALITLQSIADSRGDEYIGIDASSPQDPEASPAFMIGVNKRTVSGGPGTPPTPERVTRSLSLRELIDGGAAAGGMAPEVILSAVDGVLQLEDKEGAEPAQVKFHKDSGLLLIRGTHQQIAAVEEALDRLTASVKRERALAGSNKAADARRKLDLERAKINVESMQANFQRAAAHFARIREAAAQGTVAQEEVEQAEAQAQNAQQGLRLAQAELDAVAAGSSAPPEGRGDAGDGRPKDADAAIQALQTENQALRRRIEELERRGEKGPQKR